MSIQSVGYLLGYWIRKRWFGGSIRALALAVTCISIVGMYNTLSCRVEIPAASIITPTLKETLPKKKQLSYYDIIITRDLFSSTTKTITEDLSPMDMDNFPVRLVGVDNRFAILEHMPTQYQDVYERGEVVFNFAILHDIGLDYVDLKIENRIYRVYLSGFGGKAYEVSYSTIEQGERVSLAESYFPKQHREGVVEVSYRRYEVTRESLENILTATPEHAQAIASRFVDEGLLVYGQDKSSLFRELGLQDSDIITDINGHKPSGSVNLIKLYKTLRDHRANLKEVRVTVSRAGKEVLYTYLLK